MPPALPAGVPSELLERRPDIASAERLMASNNAQIGVNRAAYFPNVTLSFAAGGLSSFLGQLLDVPSLVWSATANATQPIYTGGRLSANMMFAQASYNESVARYRQTCFPRSRKWKTIYPAARPGTASGGLRQSRERGPGDGGHFHVALPGRLGQLPRSITADEELLSNQRLADRFKSSACSQRFN